MLHSCRKTSKFNLEFNFPNNTCDWFAQHFIFPEQYGVEGHKHKYLYSKRIRLSIIFTFLLKGMFFPKIWLIYNSHKLPYFQYKVTVTNICHSHHYLLSAMQTPSGMQQQQQPPNLFTAALWEWYEKIPDSWMNFKLECNHTCFCARVRAGFVAYDYEICTLVHSLKWITSECRRRMLVLNKVMMMMARPMSKVQSAKR